MSEPAAEVPSDGEPRTSSVAAAVESLRRSVLLCELMPGQQIRQDEMAATLGVSRVPLREALRVLAGEGLLIHRPHQGYFVAKLSAEQFQQIVFLLDYLETELIRTARWPTTEELQQLCDLNAQVLHASEASDLATAADLNRRLHFMVFRLSPQEFLLGEAERFWQLAQPYRLLHVASSDMTRSAHQHNELIDALAAHDRGLCLRISSDHRRSTTAVAIGMIDSAGASRHRPVAGL
ncbi:GntR family transcriptional regulator [Pseudonocardia sp. GCM10023141]|uniref:GntR family transcriptional regulator n=1 Tax=Pseudonocardia sp. GCM10023141 TaxID=3252653 RepID=UPI00361F7F24